ncbi:hypothetical protein [Paraburkholderia fungorum]|uniref:hypothetical protein n=1 Tax=Paraburkholderia fungorum TaxID=134537 RepID=UPI00351F0417
MVDAVGSEVTLFAPGDEVFYAGAMDRPGTNSEFHRRRRADRRTQAHFVVVRRGGGLAAYFDSCMGNALRPHADAARLAPTWRHAARSERSRGRWLHVDPVGESPQGPYFHRLCVPPRNFRVGEEARRAHERIETGKAIGKTVLEGFQ